MCTGLLDSSSSTRKDTQKIWEKLNFKTAKVHRRLPVVYSREEITKILANLKGVYRLQIELVYGTGLRKAELLSLRIKNIDFGSNNVFVRGGKGNKDRTTILPQRLIPDLTNQIEIVRQIHAIDLLEGYGDVYLHMSSIEEELA